MTQSRSGHLTLSPLDAQHRALGARMESFAGRDLPLEYSGMRQEHLAVRAAAGVFDATHRGQIEIAGRNALDAIQWLTCNDVSRLRSGQAQYSGLMTPAGTFVDDLHVYRLAHQHFMLVVSASNVAADLAWILEHIGRFGDAVALDVSSRYALVALQGPSARQLLQRLANVDLAGIGYYDFAHGEVAGVRATLSCTGSTGEDGFEVFVPPRQAPAVWQAIVGAGAVPAGMGARDTLRLEAGVRLQGQDIDERTTPLEAGLEWIVGWDKEYFIGKDALQRQKDSGPSRRLVGFEMTDEGIARQGCRVVVGGEDCGTVTSGAQAPSLDKAIGLAYVPVAHAADGSQFDVEIRGRLSRARVVPLPFYTRPKG